MSTAANTHQEYDYEEARKKKKLGALSTSFMIFKTTVGVGIYTFQYNYSKVTKNPKYLKNQILTSIEPLTLNRGHTLI